jgi:hypothetical protein
MKVMAAEYPLKRILSNIFNNAVEAMDGRGQVTLRTRQCEQGNIVLEIEDNGPGISRENLKKVLNRGFSTKECGHGLGLYHANETLRKWKGSLEIESIEGKGTIISILLISCEPEMVLLENDDLIRYGWNMLARRRGISIKTFASSKELLSQVKSFGDQTKFYLDEELGEKLRGRDVAKRLYRKGFREIFITSGHEADYFGNNKFIKGVLPKDFPAPAQ